MSILLEKARQLLSGRELCDHCLGRFFSALGSGLRNRERGRALRVVLHMTDRAIALASNGCGLCRGAFAHVPEWAERALQAVEGLEFQTYLMGTRVPFEIEALEQALQKEYDLRGEPFKQEFNREVGRLFGARLSERGRLVHVDFREPQIVLVMDLQQAKLTVQINSLFVYGRYRKLVRTIPQTRWPCRACGGRGCEECAFTGKRYAESVEELISPPLLRETRGSGTAFHGAGREDIDARMLGRGRPFVLEIKEPKIRTLDLERLQREINEQAAGKVEVSPLKLVSGSVVERLKHCEAEKIYEARVRFSAPVSPDRLREAFAVLEQTPIQQRTPRRVSHRRADLVRTRRVLAISGELVNPTEARIRVHGEGGLYIKELISGDEGRTRPSLSELVGVPAEVVELDVLEVLGDFLD
ncbi:MAG: tRNA pseudouridine(54/55) synthase Pus10 [Candidatus Bipolaricaulota bacterium]|nr:tRNA pseudouridine(54/55) synthase Pus10 [Candidatus Bipolaricaulota bacterium]MCS7274919.1 tRNA pseudouridine(54/55) synthase Pus10 [Candidatus Bipolaricaulota bacterium]MDW8110286.1 tRNA pseudouridine(54/55) synthase Pus10 [Candidatus Bipolaricaulota bacterium]MDW8329957.1 tRNA pseudouridine(54/55) synthase Pus10 [Candidatus Bipolaricaulota bacterium]